MDKYHIPQHLDAPFKIVIWTADEFLVFIIPFIFCLSFFNAPIMGIVFGMLFFIGLKKIKGEEGHHFLLHWVYWYLPPLVHYKKIPASYRREIIG